MFEAGVSIVSPFSKQIVSVWNRVEKSEAENSQVEQRIPE